MDMDQLIWRETHRRITHLEKVVKILAEAAGVKMIPCANAQCQLGEGVWQDGNECSYCDGTQIRIIPPGPETIGG